MKLTVFWSRRPVSSFTTSALLWMMLASFTVDSDGDFYLHKEPVNYVTVSTDFPNGGGTVRVISQHPLVVRVIPHDEGGAGWGKVWFHFRLTGAEPGQEISIELEKGDPPIAGIARQIVSSNDGKDYNLTAAGIASGDGKKFLYKVTIQSVDTWFAYHFPYTVNHIQERLIPALQEDANITFFEITKSIKNRPVSGIGFNSSGAPKKYGIWIQARAHAFESGASWLAHFLALWFASSDSMAVALRNMAEINIVPILDIDGVEEGRTGKNTFPYDHGRGWTHNNPFWPEIRAIQSLLKTNHNKTDLFIDIHGPGGGHHPFFIVPVERDLPFENQKLNRAGFFSVLGAKPLESRMKGEQSMTSFHFSARTGEKFDTSKGTPPQWVTNALNEHVIAMTLETNMNTSLSTPDGYRAQAAALGDAMAKYFVDGLHKK